MLPSNTLQQKWYIISRHVTSVLSRKLPKKGAICLVGVEEYRLPMTSIAVVLPTPHD